MAEKRTFEDFWFDLTREEIVTVLSWPAKEGDYPSLPDTIMLQLKKQIIEKIPSVCKYSENQYPGFPHCTLKGEKGLCDFPDCGDKWDFPEQTDMSRGTMVDMNFPEGETVKIDEDGTLQRVESSESLLFAAVPRIRRVKKK